MTDKLTQSEVEFIKKARAEGKIAVKRADGSLIALEVERPVSDKE